MTVFQTSEYRTAYASVWGRGRRFWDIETPGGAAFLQSRGHIARRLEFWAQGVADCGGVWLRGNNDSSRGDDNDSSRDDNEASEPEVVLANARALWARIEERASEHDGVQLAQIEADSPLVPLARESGWQIEAAPVCPFLPLAPTWEDTRAAWGRNTREQIGRYPRRLERDFAVEYDLATTPAQVEEMLGELFDLHGRRWRQRGQTGVLVLPARRRFHRAVCATFLERDWLRLWRLSCDGRAVSLLLCYFWGGKYWFFIGGFDPDFARYSVGTCLFARVFQHAVGEGAREFDFLRGAETYKYRLGARDREFVHLAWFAPTPRGRLLHQRTRLEGSLRARIQARWSAH